MCLLLLDIPAFSKSSSPSPSLDAVTESLVCCGECRRKTLGPGCGTCLSETDDELVHERRTWKEEDALRFLLASDGKDGMSLGGSLPFTRSSGDTRKRCSGNMVSKLGREIVDILRWLQGVNLPRAMLLISSFADPGE